MDERMDPVKSTHAACQFLSKLYKTYGKWDLALAAYNCGPGNVNKAIRRSGKTNGNFWDIYPYLPRETRGYVPAFIAVNYMMNNSEAHNLYPKVPNHIYFDTDTIEVAKPLDFELIAQGLDVSVEELKYLNPAYRMDVVPAYSNKTNILRLPHDQALIFVAQEDSLYAVAESKIANSGKLAQKFEQNKVTYRVKSGDYLGKIASKYNVSVSSIKRWNGLSSNNIRVGQKLVIYPKGSYAQNTAQTAPKKTVPKVEKNGNYTYYEIQSGDTLWDIAKSQGISVDEIMKYNANLNSGNLKPGTKIIVGVS
jgi:membrane-bound lytic murein transglycosylase D